MPKVMEWSVDVRYQVADKPLMGSARNRRFYPHTVMVLFINGGFWYVKISGPGIKADGSPAAHQASVAYGKHGIDINKAPQWVRDLIEDAKRFLREGVNA